MVLGASCPAPPARPHCGAAACAARLALSRRGSTGHALCSGLWPLKPLRRKEEGAGQRGPALTPHIPRFRGPLCGGLWSASLLCTSD